MCYLNTICCICFDSKHNLKQLLEPCTEELSYYVKLTSTIPEMIFEEMDNNRMVCQNCCENIDLIYNFREKCLMSKTKLIDYIFQRSLTGIDSTTEEHPKPQWKTLKKEGNYIKTIDNGNDKNNKNYFSLVDVNKLTTATDLEEPSFRECKEDVSVHQVFIKAEEPDNMDYEEVEGQEDDEYESDNEYSNIENPLTNTESTEEVLGLSIDPPISTTEKKHPCPLCNKRFRQASDVTRHIRIHTGEKPYECSICDKKFSDAFNLSVHKKVHAGETPFECNVCNKKFNYISSFSRHKRIHTGIKTHECNICNKMFTQVGNLSRHMKLHTGERPHECDICNKKFSQLGNLSRHMQLHTGEKPYQCDICPKKFRDSTNLAKHKKRHTKESLCE